MELRRIKEAAQLSYNRLADKTHYSRSSWERFLNGKQIPSEVAVREFAAAAGTDPEPLLELLQRATAREMIAAEPEPELVGGREAAPAPIGVSAGTGTGPSAGATAGAGT
ncbi:helix-turn-helix domain-containing protein, partial [Streptomyces sp. SID7760]|nr:helix-turn-helix domain-containing protein [Streptomyces sp. SID7760]